MGHVLGAYRARVASGALTVDEPQLAAAQALDRLAEALRAYDRPRLFSRPRRRSGLYLWGPVGRGKSMLMDLFFEAAPVIVKRRVHFHDFMLEIHAAIAKARREHRGDPIRHVADEVARRALVLCFDELQVNDIADAMILGRLFEALFNRGVVVVATSNRPPDDLYSNGLNRQLFLPFIALLKRNVEVCPVMGARDYRLERLMAAPTWHAPLGPTADAAMDLAWERLTLGARPVAYRLSVRGRETELARTAAGCLRVGFEELCARPLGAADYLEIARVFHTVLLENIPVLSQAQRNEARRFVTLIDALYEARTKLVASAAAQPDALYPQGDGAFEFERTVSRLMEMRSADYLGLARAAA